MTKETKRSGMTPVIGFEFSTKPLYLLRFGEKVYAATDSGLYVIEDGVARRAR